MKIEPNQAARLHAFLEGTLGELDTVEENLSRASDEARNQIGVTRFNVGSFMSTINVETGVISADKSQIEKIVPIVVKSGTVAKGIFKDMKRQRLLDTPSPWEGVTIGKYLEGRMQESKEFAGVLSVA